MKTSRILLVPAVAALLLSGAACFAYRGPREVRQALDAQLGVELDREFGFKVGFLGTKLALGVARLASEEPVPLSGLRRIELAVYSIPGPGNSGRHLSDLKLKGWESVIRVRDAGGEAVVLVRQERDSIRGLLLVVQDHGEDDGQVMVARLSGSLERLLKGTVRDSLAGSGREGVRKGIHAAKHGAG